MVFVGDGADAETGTLGLGSGKTVAYAFVISEESMLVDALVIVSPTEQVSDGLGW